MIASQLITDNLHVLRTSDTVEGAIEFMVSQGVSELPIIDKKKIYNYARLSVLSAVDNKQSSLAQNIPQNPHAPFAVTEHHLYEIVPLLAANELSILAVTDENGDYVGIIDQKRINKLITESLTYRGIGAVIVIRLTDRDFSPSTICRWVEENGAKVLGMMVSQTELGDLILNIKLNTTVVRAIVATFKRQGYSVEHVYLAEDQSNDDSREVDLVLKFFDL